MVSDEGEACKNHRVPDCVYLFADLARLAALPVIIRSLVWI